MLPETLSGSYQAYKSDTGTFVTWLAEEARRLSCYSAGSIKQYKQEKSQLTSVEILESARVVAAKSRQIPESIIKSVQRAIRLRKKFTIWFAKSDDHEDSNLAHAFFISTLEQALAILSTCPVSTSGRKFPSNTPEPVLAQRDSNSIQASVNRFSALKIEATGGGSRVHSTSQPKITDEPQAQLDDMEPLFALFCCLDDLHELIGFVRDVWKSYDQDNLDAQDLATASVTTNSAFELASQLLDDLQYHYPHLGNWSTFAEEFKKRPTGHIDPKSTPLALRKANTMPDLDWLFTDMAIAMTIGLSSPPSSPDKAPSGKPRRPAARRTSTSEREGFFSVINFQAWGKALPKDDSKWPEHHLPLLLKAYAPQRLTRVAQMIRIVEMLVENTNLVSTSSQASHLPVLDHLTQYLIDDPDPQNLTMHVVFMFQTVYEVFRILRRPFVQPVHDLQYHIVRISECLDFAAGTMKPMSAADLAEGYCQCANCKKEHVEYYTDASKMVNGLKALKLVTSQIRKEDMQLYKQTLSLLTSNPVLCGLTVMHLQAWFQVLGLKICNDSGTMMGMAHLYNATRVTNELKIPWPEMEEAIELCNESKVFLGSRPRDPIAFRTRYILTAGISAKAFAINKSGYEHHNRRDRDHWRGSERRRRHLEAETKLSTILYHASAKTGCMNCLCSDVQDIINPKINGKGLQRSPMTPLQILERINETMSAETPKLDLDWLDLDARCRLLVRKLYKELEDVLECAEMSIKQIGPQVAIVYEILYASNYNCACCSRDTGNMTILRDAARLLAEEIEHGGAAQYMFQSK